MGFAQTYFHKPDCERLIQCLKRYKRNVPTSTGEPGAPCHDEWSHGADMFRYAQIVAPDMSNDTNWAKPIKYPNSKVA
jgi:phage terminase large subunit